MANIATIGSSRAFYTVISGHDYRSKRKANVHFIARELAKRGPTRFFSVGFSMLSKMTRDPRLSLWTSANRAETVDSVECYLWRSLVHPVNLHSSALSSLESAAFRAYARASRPILKKWIAESHTIVLESGMAVLFFDLIKSINATARIIYICSDSLDTIGCAKFLIDELARVQNRIDGVRVPSLALLPEFPGNDNVIFVPHGMDALPDMSTMPSPFARGRNLVSVGSMLFDPDFFRIAARAFPDITFHVIGGGRKAQSLSGQNLRVYDEIPFTETLPYLKFADAGIAPYDGRKVASYLVDTSMKLMQFGAMGVPSICPHAAAGEIPDRFGYEPGDRSSIVAAINAALAHGRFAGRPALTWGVVVDRILNA